MSSGPTIPMPPVRELSSIAAENNPSRTAFGNGIDGRTVTWRAFDRESNRAANAFRGHTAQGDRIAFLCEPSVEHATLWNAGLKAGCVVSNLLTRTAPNTLRSCLDSLKPRVLVVDEGRSSFLEEHAYDSSPYVDAVVTTGEPRTDYERPMGTFTDGESDSEPDVQVGETDVAVVQWTSGTTGTPKGWCLTNRALILRGYKLACKKRFSRRTRVANVFTPAFSAWIATAIPAMFANASVFFLRPWDPERYLELVQERGLTSTNLVPTMWREILRVEDFDEYDLDSFETIEVGGETLDRTTLGRLRERICDSVTQSYAATEVLGTSITEAEMVGERIDSVGKPLMGTRIRVVERGGAPDDVVEPGEIGEVIVKGSDAAVWMWGDSERTAEAFTEGWWYSGDLGYKDEDGYLYIEGRDDDMILSKGIKVFPTPVEERLNAHPDVVEAGVVGLADDEYGERVTAYIVPSDPDLAEGELDEWCLESDDLARIERPRAYHFTDGTLPRTATGKLDRKEIGERLGE